MHYKSGNPPWSTTRKHFQYSISKAKQARGCSHYNKDLPSTEYIIQKFITVTVNSVNIVWIALNITKTKCWREMEIIYKLSDCYISDRVESTLRAWLKPSTMLIHCAVCLENWLAWTWRVFTSWSSLRWFTYAWATLRRHGKQQNHEECH